MKRVLSILLVTLLAFSVMSIMTVGATGDPTITVETVEGTAGNQVDVKVSISNNPGITFLQVKVAYSANDVSISKATGVAPYAPLTTNLRNANHNPALVQFDSEYAVSDNGDFAKLTFDVLEGAKTSDLTITSVSAFDNDLKPVNFAKVNGKITVQSAAPSAQDQFEAAIATPITKGSDDVFGGNVAFTKGLEMVGVQEKANASDVRFITAVSKDVLNDAGVTDYGYVFAKSSKKVADDKIANLTVNSVKAANKYSCKGSTCAAAGAYGDGSKDYSYVTCGVNNIPEGYDIVARFYVETSYGTTYYYATYGNLDGIVYSYVTA